MSDVPTFERLMRTHAWQPIPGCPGRFALQGQPPGTTVSDLLGAEPAIRAYQVPTARDKVLVTQLADGGLISYEREDGSYLHTLNTPDGFERKLKQLGLK